ncbi:MAG: hypothetical protein A2Y19_09945 [Firmicutes bacterium GWE2_51_13]|nr:MAG: hypothetical protein A2Y19_09945 [Firmicutes bacterium GWE2_51_13]
MEKKFETRNTVSEGNMPKSIVMILFSIIEVLLGFRFVFKLMGANASNVFVSGIYNFTQFFVGIFEGIFSKATTGGAETEAVFEPATLIAIIVVGLIAWGVMKLMAQTAQRTRSTQSEYRNNDVRNENQNTQNAQNTTNDVNPTEVKNEDQNRIN